MWLCSSSLRVPEDTELARSASLSHRSTLLLWQTGRLTSFIPVAPLCSSPPSQTILAKKKKKNPQWWVHDYTASPLLVSVDSVCGALEDIGAWTIHIHFKKCVKYTAEFCHKRSEYRINYLFDCGSHTWTMPSNNKCPQSLPHHLLAAEE